MQSTLPGSNPDQILGVLINNLGTPDSYRIKDVRNFLREFLWDPRVVKAPRAIWWIVLNVIILNTRPRRSAEAYQRIWWTDGSPLLSISRKQVDLIRQALTESNTHILVELGMRYGSPSIESALLRLRDAGASRFLILPLYPQFSYTTTASVDDEASRVCRKFQLNDIKVIQSYFFRSGVHRSSDQFGKDMLGGSRQGGNNTDILPRHTPGLFR